MRTVLTVSGLAVMTTMMTACAGPPDPSTARTPPSVTAATLDRARDSEQVDRVGPEDGALRPDGIRDFSFTTRVDGPVAAIFLVTVDEHRTPDGKFQADTFVGDVASPPELGKKAGKVTSGLAVFEGDKMLNTEDGSLPLLSAGPHTLSLYVAPNPSLVATSRLRIYVLRPDNSLAPGATLASFTR